MQLEGTLQHRELAKSQSENTGCHGCNASEVDITNQPWDRFVEGLCTAPKTPMPHSHGLNPLSKVLALLPRKNHLSSSNHLHHLIFLVEKRNGMGLVSGGVDKSKHSTPPLLV